ncbi:mediator of RNA polymerase II transcription subunit 1-like [Protopterus annectens]|uniref:mediator of RNA polymerase II transcription subunit 1-like n=1 Tax=Protopterus annectens TaxID=7888 RepID=UPI001CFB180F|nr:mediator of RNA polymerase II transcription subunit 1-like [Protopterus annectens]
MERDLGARIGGIEKVLCHIAEMMPCLALTQVADAGDSGDSSKGEHANPLKVILKNTKKPKPVCRICLQRKWRLPFFQLLHDIRVGHLMNLKYYVSPYDLFADTGEQIILNDNNVPRSLGMNVSVTIEGTALMYKLPIAPLISGSHPVDNKGTPSFTSVNSANSVDFPACFFLKFPRPIPVSREFIQKIQNCTGIPVMDSIPQFVPLYELITQFELSKDDDSIPLNHNMRFYASLPGQQHCYFLNKDAPLPDGRCLQGMLLSKIPFVHPGQVPPILDFIRNQVAYNSLIGSCVKRTILKERK